MEEGLNYLQSFNPVESKAELLEKTLTGRKDLADYLASLVIESATTGNKHQHLMIGPRGSGKTHVLRVLYNRVSRLKKLKKKLTIAYLCEDEYGIASFMDFIIRMLRAFIKWNPEEAGYLDGEIDKLKKVPFEDQEKVAQQILLKYIGKTTCLIIVENISTIFTGMELDGQRRLRDMLQQHGRFTIMASNQALFKDIQFEDRPFHNFFDITHLKRLTAEEAIEFLKSIAQWEEKTDLLAFLEEPEGIGRIKAIYEITGGNHRLLVTFYQFLKTDYKNNLSQSFIKTINDLIPYYQSFMDLLSALQQKIIQYLCQKRIPASVKEIAENCFSAPNTISKQMSNLVRLKYVDAALSSGRETFYELAEPLLRICFEVKENRGGPIKLFVDFLGNLYSAREINRKYMHFHILGRTLGEKQDVDFDLEKDYYLEALRKYFPDFFDQFNLKKFEEQDQEYQIKTYVEEAEKAGAYAEMLNITSQLDQKDKFLLLKEAKAYDETGNFTQGQENADMILRSNPLDVDALLYCGESLHNQWRFDEASEYLKKVLAIDKHNIRALFLHIIGMIGLGKLEEAANYMDDFLKLEKLVEKSFMFTTIGALAASRSRLAKKAITFLKKGMKQRKLKNILDYEFLIHCRMKLNDLEEIRSDFKQLLELLKNESKNNRAISSLRDILSYLFVFGKNDYPVMLLKQWFNLIEEYDLIVEFFTSLILVIFDLLRIYEKIEIDRFEFIESTLIEFFGSYPLFSNPHKYLNIGIRHLKKNEKNVLMEFTKEERRTFNEFVLEPIAKKSKSE